MSGQHAKRPPEISELLGALARFGVRYVLTGSVAALAYGVDIGQAGDLDITPALDEENLSRLGALLRELEARIDPDAPMGHWETLPDGERTWRADAMTPEVREQIANWRPDPADVSTFDHLFRTRLGNFDVVPELGGTYEMLMKRAARIEAWGQDIWVAHVDELLAALTVPRRAKDVSRVRQLRVIQRRRGERGVRG